MEVNAAPTPESGFTRFSCDFCRQKKLKCSRELPKCNSCKPWPGSCDYSREKSSSFTQTNISRMSPDVGMIAPRNPLQPDHIDRRLARLEQAVQSLTDSVHQALRAAPTASSRRDGFDRPNEPDRIVSTAKNRSEPGLYIGQSHSFSFLKETPAIIEEATPQHPSTAARESAHSELQNLSTALTEAQVDQKAGEGDMAFYVPSRPVGYRLISQFLEQAELSEVFFRVPSDDVLRRVIFEPQKVRERAWVVFVNYTLLSALSTDTYKSDEAEKLRRNIQLALNDSSIFLEPSQANVQALTLLAMHGEDYTAPNLSWMLLGHACRQAEALGLHTPAHQDVESRQQRLCLFWLLFMIDKSCSLAFGRPAFLPTALYCNVPPPDDHFLLKFHPHDCTALGNSQAPSQTSTFGAVFFSRSVEIAKLTGRILDVLATSESFLAKTNLRSELEAFYEDTYQVLAKILKAESVSANAGQQREMSLGITSFKFHYLHIFILLLKGDESFSSLRISSARTAISLLPSMVSNWSSVYNGVVWQLLYFPFTPFFVVFENIIHLRGSLAPRVEQDLSLLSTTVSYFASMRSQMRTLSTLCSRLQHIAAVFLHLAQTHVYQGASTEVDGKLFSVSQIPNVRRSDQSHGLAFSASNTQTNNDAAGSYPHAPESLAAVDMGELDIANYLEWLPADIDFPWTMTETERQGPPANDVVASGDNVHSESYRGIKRPFDSTFDWFSWDAYCAGAEPNRSFQ